MRNLRDNQYTFLMRVVGAIALFGIIVEVIVGIVLLNVVMGKTFNCSNQNNTINVLEGLIDKITMFIMIWPCGIVIAEIFIVRFVVSKFAKVTNITSDRKMDLQECKKQ